MDNDPETTDFDARLSALDRAINFHAGRLAEPSECVATAHLFLRYLTETTTTATMTAGGPVVPLDL